MISPGLCGRALLPTGPRSLSGSIRLGMFSCTVEKIKIYFLDVLLSHHTVWSHTPVHQAPTTAAPGPPAKPGTPRKQPPPCTQIATPPGVTAGPKPPGDPLLDPPTPARTESSPDKKAEQPPPHRIHLHARPTATPGQHLNAQSALGQHCPSTSIPILPGP
ncbi:hypothetical protein ATANTOWER_019962 [Ataeniobius toweri]|uniref:Uncharacterized protein n=1 Tax=Ataeniobius toweri TaxID=208326 RepID=A0ABU7CAF8_9TELE|nr:hypothetical protein [Ataeniobius toweri]